MSTGTGRWQQLRAIFDELVDLAIPEQNDRLAKLTAADPELRAELESLFAADRAVGDRFEHPPTLPDQPDEDSNPPLAPASRIGSYRVIREIGRGGMGAVYEAVRVDAGFAKRVAIKMVVRGRDTELILRRFRYERQILARLEHKNIATLLDGGVTDEGQPYFAMEYVEGERIDRYCDGRRLGIRARLQLMRQVCAAVQYAHQNLVVHRDLKPSNILVGPDGTVKLLDFGIAKLIDPVTGDQELTEPGMLPMTTGYASPEQLRGETVSTATDIYSLGVVLYELVAGRPPFQFGELPVLEIRRRMLEETPAAPSRVAVRLPRSLAGELDHIVLMALRKEPERRYASAEQLSEDLRRLLGGLPIQAQPDSLRYRARKFVARNRAAVAALGVVFLTLLGGLGVSLWQSRSVQRERAKAEAVSQFLESLLLSSSPEVSVSDKSSRQRTVSDVLDAAALRLETEDLSSQPEVKAILQGIVGSSYLSQGQYDLAEKNLRAALAAQERLYGRDSPELLNTLVGLASLALSRADYPAAEQIYQRRVAILRSEQRRGRIAPEILAVALSDFAVLRRARGRSEDAEALLREALELSPRIPPEARAKVGHAEAILALTLLDRGKFAEAEAYARNLVAGFRSEPNPESPELCSGLTILGSILMEKGEPREAVADLQEAEAIYRKLYDSNFVAIYDNVRLQAQALYLLGRYQEAEARIDETLEKYRRLVQPQYISFATALTVKGLIQNQRGKSHDAEKTLREALRLRSENLPAGHFMSAMTEGALGEVLVGQRRFVEAEPLLLSSYQSLKRSQATQNQRTAAARSRLVALYTAWNRPEQLAKLQ